MARPSSESLIQIAPEKEPAPALIPDSGLSIVVKQFKFSGNDSLTPAILAPLVAPYLGKALTLDRLNDAADAIRRHYRNHGWFLAQAYIPAQAAKDGVIEIAVLEGRLDQVTIKVAPDAPISAAYATRLVQHFLQTKQVITENGIESPLLLLRDVPRIDAKSVIDPGSALGTASIVVNVVQDPDAPVISGSLELDNYGSAVSGANRLGGEVNLNNPYGLGDQLSLRGFLADVSGNSFGRGAYTLPVGPSGTRVGASIARLDYVLGGLFSALRPNGVANVASVNVAQPLMRHKDANLFAQLILEQKKLTDSITTPVSIEKSSLSSLRLQLSGDTRDELAGVNVYSLSVMRGKLSLDNAERDQDANTGAHSAGGFGKLVYSFQRLQQFAPGLHLMLNLSGQMANKNLHSAEKFSIGGESTVRAFPVGELVGDQGYTATAELRYAVPQLKKGKFDVVSTLFYDTGHVTKNHDNSLLKAAINQGTISGAGVGLNVGYGDNYLLKVAAAWPVAGISENEPKKGARVWVQASYSF